VICYNINNFGNVETCILDSISFWKDGFLNGPAIDYFGSGALSDFAFFNNGNLTDCMSTKAINIYRYHIPFWLSQTLSVLKTELKKHSVKFLIL
jgi:restriction endonuclease S subunit